MRCGVETCRDSSSRFIDIWSLLLDSFFFSSLQLYTRPSEINFDSYCGEKSNHSLFLSILLIYIPPPFPSVPSISKAHSLPLLYSALHRECVCVIDIQRDERSPGPQTCCWNWVLIPLVQKGSYNTHTHTYIYIDILPLWLYNRTVLLYTGKDDAGLYIHAHTYI